MSEIYKPETRPNQNVFVKGSGLTKRELIAAMAMSELLNTCSVDLAAERAVQAADLLIEELNKPKK